ncbi:MAG TPA: serine/threonine protein kinase, partial [Polyangiaceae bacterium]|nr:serine/threonine protein kinase [Polyangiaceae bacterium]
RLGEGGMGTVYEAVHLAIHRRVAIKVLKAGHAGDQLMIQRFEREAQAAGRIGSEHIAEVHDVGSLPTGERYMILEYLDGESLSDRLRRCGRLRSDEVLPLLVQLLDGLQMAHDAGIIHRDLKPANIFLVRDRKGYDDFVKILDFGVSKFRDLNEADGMTTTGTIVGTPHYMAPELTKGARLADHRSDIYSAGAVAYRALSGRPPYHGDTIHELLTRLITEPPPPLERLVPDMDPSVGRLIHRALERDPAARYATAADFAIEVRCWLEERGLSPDGRTSLSSLPGSASGSQRSPHGSGAIPAPRASSDPNALRSPCGSAPGPRPPLGTDPRERATVVDRPSGRSEPPSVLTPSPSIYDSHMFKGRSSRFGVVMTLGALLVVAVAVAVSLYGAPADSGPSAAEQTPVATTVPVAAAPAMREPSATASASATTSASASASATASAATTARPPRIRPVRPRRPEREIRTDL